MGPYRNIWGPQSISTAFNKFFFTIFSLTLLTQEGDPVEITDFLRAFHFFVFLSRVDLHVSTCSGGSGECPAVPKINGVLIRDTPPQPDVRLTRHTPQPPDRQPATRADTSSVRQTPSSPRRRPSISHSQADAQLARQAHPAVQADNARHWRYRFSSRISAS